MISCKINFIGCILPFFIQVFLLFAAENNLSQKEQKALAEEEAAKKENKEAVHTDFCYELNTQRASCSYACNKASEKGGRCRL